MQEQVPVVAKGDEFTWCSSTCVVARIETDAVVFTIPARGQSEQRMELDTFITNLEQGIVIL